MRTVLLLVFSGVIAASSLVGAAAKLPAFKVERWVNSPPLTAEGLRGEEALDAMGQAYGLLLSTDPLMLQAQLQTYAAALDDDDVRTAVREGYGDLYSYVERVSGASDQRLARFFANGMLLNVIAAMGFHEEAHPEPWAFRLLTGCREGGDA